MSAAEALQMAHAAGIDLSFDGNDLVLEAPSEPPFAVLDMLRRHKAGVVDAAATWAAGPLLRLVCRGMASSFSTSSAGTAEPDAGLTYAAKPRLAFEWCLSEWLNRNPGLFAAG